MHRWARRTGIVLGGSILAKTAHITLSDEWADVWYSVRKNTIGLNITAVARIPSHEHLNTHHKQRVVVLGTGWGAVNFIRHLDPENVHVTVVSPRSFFFYTPLLAGDLCFVVDYMIFFFYN
jgi:hypothetical protein